MVYPLERPKIVSKYGVMRNIFGTTRLHKGLDIVSTTGDRNVKAIKDGIYRGTFYDKNGFGNYVTIQHDDGVRTIYAHLDSFAYIPKGTRIKAGTVLGIEGTTGRSTGIHLHLEGRKAPYLPVNHINIAEYMGIENELGEFKETVERKFGYTKEEAMDKVREATGFEEKTMQYLDDYEYNFDLFAKLANAIEPK